MTSSFDGSFRPVISFTGAIDHFEEPTDNDESLRLVDALPDEPCEFELWPERRLGTLVRELLSPLSREKPLAVGVAKLSVDSVLLVTVDHSEVVVSCVPTEVELWPGCNNDLLLSGSLILSLFLRALLFGGLLDIFLIKNGKKVSKKENVK